MIGDFLVRRAPSPMHVACSESPTPVVSSHLQPSAATPHRGVARLGGGTALEGPSFPKVTRHRKSGYTNDG